MKNTFKKRRLWLSIALSAMLGFQFLPTPIAGANAPVGDYIVLLTENADLQTKISNQVVVVGKNGKISISSKTTVITKLNSRAGNNRDSKNNRVVAPKKSVKGKAVAPKKSTLQSKASTNKSSK